MSRDAGSPHPALPATARVLANGVLSLGGCSVEDLIDSFGTPLYVYDVDEIQTRLAGCHVAFEGEGTLHYAAKAYLARWLIDLIREQHVGIDICSIGELEMAMRAGFPTERLRLHGNNKSVTLLTYAIAARLGAIVVDSVTELNQVVDIARQSNQPTRILIRLNPGITAHTHHYLQTGTTDSKFGISIASGEARTATLTALNASKSIELLGFHAHIGTQIFDVGPYLQLIDTLVRFAHTIERETGFWPAQLSPGGGFGITYTDELPLSISDTILAMRRQLRTDRHSQNTHLGIELGRALIGPAGVALYRVGTVKKIVGVRTYVSVDGGMADNIRPALYQARYAALAASQMHARERANVRIVGPYCESGDILIDDIPLQNVVPGDIIAIPAAGAYCLAMSSNYNAAFRPAVVTVTGGIARLVQRRQTVDDLLSVDVNGDH